ncbi:uncharacterized protein KGF55_001631, partial [Candida pseudojiufengensis]|uniref:uncharacterized protein n=1 Tax=Candida pseudojiufengensis TaxID=497109 RepID=UPI002224D05B
MTNTTNEVELQTSNNTIDIPPSIKDKQNITKILNSINYHKNTLSITTKNVQNNSEAIKLYKLCTGSDIICLQETVNATFKPLNQDQYTCYHKTNSRVGIVINNTSTPKFEIIDHMNIQSIMTGYQDRVSDILIKMIHNKTYIRIINIYAPCSNFSIQQKFWQELKHAMDYTNNNSITNKEISTVLVGDFNCILNKIDSEKGDEISRTEKNATKELKEILEQNELKDVFRHIKPTTKIFTNRNMINKRRLDRYYININLLQQILCYYQSNHEGMKSTHETLTIKIILNKTPSIKKGKRRYVFNSELLELSNFEPKISYEDLLKQLKELQLSQKSILNTTIPQFNPNSTIFKDLAIRYKKSRFNLDKTITAITDENKTETGTTTPQILQIATKYYKTLYTSQPNQLLQQQQMNYLSDFQKSITEEEKLQLDRPLELTEFTQCLGSCSNQSSPGKDGICYRTLKLIWKDIGHTVVEIGNRMMLQQTVPSEINKVIITLLPKKSQNSIRSITEFRPISLTNTILRLISAVANARIQPLLSQVISHNQVGFLRDRLMSNNIQKIKHVYQHINKNHTSLEGLFFMDLEKAFDRIDHKYLRNVIKQINIGEKFSNLLMAMTTNQTAHLEINNVSGEEFEFGCGVRQGLPISPILFIIALEPLLQKLENKLTGIEMMEGIHAKVIAYADDVAICIKGDDDSKTLLHEIDSFCQVSNSKLNPHKSLLLTKNPAYKLTAEFRTENISTFPFTYLGIPFNHFEWKEFFDKITKHLNIIMLRQTPLHLRATGYNTYIFSKLYHLDIMIPMKEKQIKEIMKNIHQKFKGTRMETVTSLKKQGGYGLLDLNQQLIGSRAKIIYQVLFEPYNWHNIIWRNKIQQLVDDHWISNYDAQKDEITTPYWYDFLTTAVENDPTTNIKQIINKSDHFDHFEKECLHAWFKITKPYRKGILNNVTTNLEESKSRKRNAITFQQINNPTLEDLQTYKQRS